MTASLPDNLISSSSTHTLDIARQEYQYNYTHIPSIAMVDQLSLAEEFATNWYFLLAQQLRVVFVNTLIVNRGNQGSKSIRDD
ncbi:MAG: lipoxygenase family protein, partial [Nostoc sp.]